jgi:hypothetical protein
MPDRDAIRIPEFLMKTWLDALCSFQLVPLLLLCCAMYCSVQIDTRKLSEGALKVLLCRTGTVFNCKIWPNEASAFFSSQLLVASTFNRSPIIK